MVETGKAGPDGQKS